MHSNPRQIAHLRRTTIDHALGLQGITGIGNGVFWIEFDAPGLKQFGQIRGCVWRRRTARPDLALRMRVDENQRRAAIHHPLIDDIKRLLGQILRLNDHQHARIVWQFLNIALQALHVEKLLHLHKHLLLAHAHLRIALQVHLVNHRDDGLALTVKFRHEAGEIIFKKCFALGRERTDGRFTRRRIGCCKAEEKPIAALLRLHGTDAESNGPVLFFRIGLGIDDFENDPALGGCDIGIEHGTHARGKGRNLRRFTREARRHEETETDRLGQSPDHGLGAGAQRIKFLLREIDARAAQRVGANDIDANKDNRAENCGDDDETCCGECLGHISPLTRPCAHRGSGH